MSSRLLFALAATLAASSSYAATFCVSTATELKNALTTAAGNNEDDVIQLTAGTFVPPATYGFFYSSGQPYSLTLKGGFGNLCTVSSESAALSIIDGGGVNGLFRIFGTASAGAVHLELARMTLQNGSDAQSHYALVHIAPGDFATNTVTLDRVVMRDNVSSAAAIFVDAPGSIVVQNSVFVDNKIQPGDDRYLLAYFHSYNPNGSSGGVVFNGNTVANNINTGVLGGAEFLIGVDDGPLSLANSIFWGNTQNDLVVNAVGSTVAQVSDSDIGTQQFYGAVSSTNLYSTDPVFVGSGDYSLAANSPLRDLGDILATGGIGSYDAAGHARMNYGSMDLGAFQANSDGIFKDGFQ